MAVRAFHTLRLQWFTRKGNPDSYDTNPTPTTEPVYIDIDIEEMPDLRVDVDPYDDGEVYDATGGPPPPPLLSLCLGGRDSSSGGAPPRKADV